MYIQLTFFYSGVDFPARPRFFQKLPGRPDRQKIFVRKKDPQFFFAVKKYARTYTKNVHENCKKKMMNRETITR
jgi:hypothetical protein